MKQMLTKIGMALLFMLSFQNLSAYDFEVDGIYYNIISAGEMTCRVTSGDNKYEGDVKIPAKVSFGGRDLTVTMIGEKAFYKCSSLMSVEIPNSVTEIGYEVFSGCSSLTSVEIPNSVTVIGSDAFIGCSSLTSVEIPNSVAKIGSNAFRNCSSLTSIEIPNSVTLIGEKAFSGCSSLTSVEIPNSVTEIGWAAFSGCSSLTSVAIPNSVTEIGGYAFSGCSSLTSVELSNSLTEIKLSVFVDCSSLTSVTIPNSVTEISLYAFSGCSSLTSIEIPNSVTEIGNYAFDGCSSLKYLSLNATEIPILFLQNSSDFTVTYNQFKNTPIEELHLGRNISFEFDRRGNTLSGFDQLKKLYVSDNVSIGLIWDKCKDLEELTIGENVELSSCSSKSKLKSITINSNIPPKCPEFTQMQYVNINVYVPKGSLGTYMAADGWKNFWNLQEIGNETGVEDISEALDIVETGRFDINGMPVDEDYKGIVIIRYSDGSTVKRIVR